MKRWGRCGEEEDAEMGSINMIKRNRRGQKKLLVK
jgi:hypothetical protein